MNQLGRSPLVALAVLLAALLACDESYDSLDYARLGIAASDAAGTPVPTSAGAACVTLPVLRGSEVERSFDVSGSLAVEVTADRNGVVVHFAHASPAVDDRTISKDQLEATYFQEIQVWDQTGKSYLVQLSSECEPGA
ncbi:MAG: hypothetical protein U0263_42200, partial [Polyangiaceae bacterium]